MKKLPIFTILMLLLLMFSVIATGLSSAPGSVNIVVEDNSEANDRYETTFTLTNTETNTSLPPLMNISLTHDLINIEDNDNDILSVTLIPNTILSLESGQSTDVLVAVEVEKGFNADTISGTITATADDNTTMEIPIDVEVRPVACKAGELGDLSLNIRDPDNGDTFTEDETVTLNVDVDNNDNNDMKVVVKAVVYNMDEGRVIDGDSNKQTIKDNSDERFELSLDLNKYINDGDDYRIFVKAYEYSDEDINCVMDDLSIDVEEIPIDIIDYQISPTTVYCGDTLNVEVEVENIGSNGPEDLRVRFLNTELGVGEQSSEFELDEGESRTKRFTDKVPKNAKEGNYEIKFVADYGTGVVEKFDNINVMCPKEEPKSQQVVVIRSPPVKPQSEEVTVSGANTFEWEEKNIWEKVVSNQIPSEAWLFADLVLMVLVLLLLLKLFKRR